MLAFLEMAADFLADVRNGGLFGLLEMVSPAVQPLAPAFRLLGDDPLDKSDEFRCNHEIIKCRNINK